MKKYNLKDVFVPVGFPTVTYLQRIELEKAVTRAKMTQSRHISIYGLSKSGKSNLWTKMYNDNERLKLGINHNMTIADIYSEILDLLNAYYVSEKASSNEINAGLFSELQMGIQKLLSVKVQSNANVGLSNSEKSLPFSKPVISSNTVLKFLKPSGKIIVFEDFHYANDEVIRNLAQDLKAFSDGGCQFVFVSVPSVTGKLLKENRELLGRITDIEVKFFTDTELLEIMNKGLIALNIEFSDSLKNSIISESNGSAAILQDICQQICIESSIYITQKDKIIITDSEVFTNACRAVAEGQKSLYQDIVDAVSLHEHGNNTTQIYRWILRVIKTTSITDNGISSAEVYRKMVELGHTTIQRGSVTNGLKYMPQILDKKNLLPIFEIDDNGVFYVRDRYMMFVLKWIPEMVDSLFTPLTI